MTSAPEATEPTIVTSPCGKMIDWPERTGVRDDQRAHLRHARRGRHRHCVAFPARGVRGLRRNDRRIDRLGRLASGADQRRQGRAEDRRLGALEAEDADFALRELGDQCGESFMVEVHRGAVEDHRPPPEETWRAGQPVVDLRRAMPRRAAPARARAPGTNGHGSVGIGGFLRGLSRASFRLTNGYDLAASRLMAG